MPTYTKTGTITGKTALVTGAVGVLGLATTRALLGLGIRVVLVDIMTDLILFLITAGFVGSCCLIGHFLK